MRFLADVNIPQSAIAHLTKLGHDVLDLKRVNKSSSDTIVIKLAREEKRIILTLDKDFIVLTQFPMYQIATIVIRLKKQTPQSILKYIDELLENQKPKILEKSLTIIKEDLAESHPF